MKSGRKHERMRGINKGRMLELKEREKEGITEERTGNEGE